MILLVKKVVGLVGGVVGEYYFNGEFVIGMVFRDN